jgi:hypothetical protein
MEGVGYLKTKINTSRVCSKTFLYNLDRNNPSIQSMAILDKKHCEDSSELETSSSYDLRRKAVGHSPNWFPCNRQYYVPLKVLN